MIPRSPWVSPLAYSALVLLGTTALVSGNALLGDSDASPALFVAAWWPALLALALCLVGRERKKTLSQLGLTTRGQWRWYGLAGLLPTIPLLLGYFVAWGVGLVGINHPDLTTSPFGGPVSLVLTLLFLALGEELGWRGFLLPRLSQVLPLKAALPLSGLIWALWHYGFFFWAGYHAGDDNLALDLLLFTLTVVCLGVVIGWVRLAGGSLWPVVLLHAMSNVVWIECEQVFTLKQPGWDYVAGESGLVALLVWGALATWVWRQLPTLLKWDGAVSVQTYSQAPAALPDEQAGGDVLA
jgi:membrane protease YdiL (CAAX protease family)